MNCTVQRQSKHRHGFTLIELLVVIAIIGLLSSVVLASLNSARDRAGDARRKSDLKQIQLALELYYSEHGTYVVSGSGYNNGGQGWFSHQGSSGYTTSVAQGLVNAGFLGAPIADPSGSTAGNSNGHTGYMIRTSSTGYTVWANLENPSASDTATQSSCVFSDYDGYHSSYPESARINYCVSS